MSPLRTALALVACAVLMSCVRPQTPTITDPPPTPAPSPVDGPPGVAPVKLADRESGTAECGEFTITWVEGDPDTDDLPSLEVREGERIVLGRSGEAPFEHFQPLWCGDLTADGQTSLLFTTYSGGAHCCFLAEIVVLGEEAKFLLSVDLGNYGEFLELEQLDGDQAYELTAASDLFAYFHLSFAASPGIPLVFDFDGSSFVVATEKFPDIVRAQIADGYKQISELEADQPEDVKRGLALGIYGGHLILDEGPEGLQTIKQRVPSVADWLDEVAAEAEDLFKKKYGAQSRSDPE